MIGFLSGRLRDRDPSGRLLVDVNGVGYVVHVPVSTLLELPREGATVELLVNTQVREDSLTLYGFRTAAERDVFERLLSVSGVGPRTALAALSALGAAELAAAIRDSNVRRLSSVPGIGKKTAERMVIDLRDRIAAPRAETPGARPGGPADDVVSALVNLGYADKAAGKAVADALDEAGGALPFEALLRASLKALGRG